MFISNVLTSFRVLWRNRFTTVINISGLSVGIAACVFIFMFVENELSYDQHHSKKNRIFRIVSDLSMGGEIDHIGLSSYMLSPTLKQDYPEVEEAVRLMWIGKQTMWVDDKPFQFADNAMSDGGFFPIFDYEFIDGDPKTALVEPQSVVISDAVALTMFGTTTEVLGKMIRYARQSYKITGVIKDQKDRSHVYFSTIVSLNSIQPQYENALKNDWFYLAQTNYVLLRNESDAVLFKSKLDALRDKYIVPWLKQVNTDGTIDFKAQPLTEIHLDNEYRSGYAKTGNRNYIYIFSVLAIFILIVACINYVNLAIATAGKRAKEIGIRKTAGANAAMLFRKFMTESILITLQAVFLALLWVLLLLPVFNNITEKSLQIPYSPAMLGCLFMLIVLIGFVAGAYPAIYLSRMQPGLVLKSNKMPGTFSVWLRKSLVVLQFFIAVSFMTCTIVVYAQMHFIRDQNMGFDKEQLLVVSVPVPDTAFVGKFDLLKQELQNYSSVKSIAVTSNIPGSSTGTLIHAIQSADHQRQEKAINYMVVSHDFIPVMGMKMVSGRNFSEQFVTDDTAAFIVNEAALKTYGWSDPYSLHLENGMGNSGKIIGVVKDFNYRSMHEPVQPLVMVLGNRIQGQMLIKIEAGKEKETIDFVESVWNKYSKKYPFEYFFMDENFDKLYRSENRMMKLFTAFSLISLVLSSVGLYALVTYTLEQRVKEIGIRKVMGASVTTIVLGVVKEYGILVLVALTGAIPVCIYFMQKWLADFAYRTSLELWMFALAGFVSVCIAALTVCFQTIKAASVNPVKSLRYE